MESFLTFFEMAVEKYWIFWGKCKNIIEWIELHVILNTIYVVFAHFDFSNARLL